jgi:hypothetical protein
MSDPDEEVAAANAAIKLCSTILLPPGTILRTPLGELLEVLYYGEGGKWTIVQVLERDSCDPRIVSISRTPEGERRDVLSSRESRITKRLYGHATILELPRGAPPLSRWKRAAPSGSEQ